ncbi:hypothetical protein [Prosthecobacter sp.]|nr:hypothetical protein [Prosthecobacter sp.]MDI1315416.1 hypothetical protein [Prosthecobacter sp.]
MSFSFLARVSRFDEFDALGVQAGALPPEVLLLTLPASVLSSSSSR